MGFHGVAAASALALAALSLRATVSLSPFSGKGRPPMYGDAECQRHWMEVAVNLPIGEWYRNTLANDLLYWGPDYPPATMGLSWIAGMISQRFAPGTVAWVTSRGCEDFSCVLLMRLSTLVFDSFTFVTAALCFARFQNGGQRWSINRAAALLLMQPAMLIIDHGHFQWNCVCLGATVAAVVLLGRGRWMLGAAAFAVALNVKQIALYYAPAFFVYLLVVCLRGGASGLLGLPPSRTSVTSQILAVALVGAAVVAVFALFWSPFCVWASPDVGCLSSLAAVLGRLFPFDRSLFEDKVSNLWCAAEPLLRLRSRIYADTSGSLRGRVAAVSAALTGVMMLPALVGLASRLWALSSKVAVTAWHAHFAEDAGEPAVSATVDAQTGSRSSNKRRATSDALADWAPWELLCATLAAVSLAFFLASYQVHEKSILLPLLPIALLQHRLPLLSAWFSAVATWSMWPLLAKDDLLLPAVLLTVLHAACAWPTVNEAQKREGSMIATMSNGRLTPTGAASTMQSICCASLAGLVAIMAAAAAVPPPARLPDLWPYLSAVYVSGLLLLTLVFTSCALFQWGGRGIRGANKSD